MRLDGEERLGSEVGGEFWVEHLGRVEREEVGQKTGDVRRSHRGTGHGGGSGSAADVSRLDVETGGKDIDTFTEVGEVCTLITESGSTDSDGVLSSSGRVVASITVIITCQPKCKRLKNKRGR